MAIDPNSPDFWFQLGQGESRTLPRQTWERMVPPAEVDSLIRAQVMVELPTDKIDGRSDRYDLESGVQRYTIEVDDGGDLCRAFPEGPGAPLHVERRKVSVLTAHPSKLLAMLAEKNGLTALDPFRDMKSGLADVGRINLGGRWVTWSLCLNAAALKAPAVLAYYREKTGNGDLAVVSVSETAPWPSEWTRHPRIVQAKLPTSASGWFLDRRRFCVPELGFHAKHVASQLYRFAGVALIIAEAEGAIFLYGYDMGLKRDTRPFKYITQLAGLAPSPVEFDFFVNDVLKYSHQSDPRQAAYEDQADIRKAIKQNLSDEATRERGLALFKSRGAGKLVLPLTREEILRWNAAFF